MSVSRLLFSSAGLMLLAGSVRAQPAPETDPLYHVEVVIFEWTEGNRAEEDFFHNQAPGTSEPAVPLLRLPDIGLESVRFGLPGSQSGIGAFDDRTGPSNAAPDTGSTDAIAGEVEAQNGLAPEATPLPTDRLQLFELGGDSAGGRGPDGPATPAMLPADGFRILAADELQLGDIEARMSNRRAYRVLAHVGWVQTGVDPGRAPNIDLRYLGITNPAGTISFNLRRFLHVAVDLTFVDGRGTFWQSQPGYGPGPLVYAPSYHLGTERNAFRSGELQYIDHPVFGVFVLITPAPEPEAAPATGSEPGSPAA